MTLDEVRIEIDRIDNEMKPLFLKRMECARHVAEAKVEMGSDSIFMLERELEILDKRGADVEPEQKEAYETFLRHLMSISRRYQYGLMDELRETAVEHALEMAGLEKNAEHKRIKIGFFCEKAASDLNLFVNMAKLNGIQIDQMSLDTEDGIQKILMVLDGNVNDKNVRQFLAQVLKEAKGCQILELI